MAEFARFFTEQVAPVMPETGAGPPACFESEPAENTFPALPIRTCESVFVWFSLFESSDSYSDHTRRLARSRTWPDRVLPELRTRLKHEPQHLRLEPTVRSRLR